MKKRLITGAIMLAILLPLVIINTDITDTLYVFLAMFMCFVGGYEYVSKAFANRKGLGIYKIIVPIFSSFLAFSACIATCQLGSNDWWFGVASYKYFLLSLLVFLCGLVIICAISIFNKNTSGNDVSTCFCALGYTGLMLGYALSIRFLEPRNLNSYGIVLNGTKCFLYVYTIVILTDSFAYIFGKALGKNKLCPSISPNKTKEGALAGLIGGSIFGVLGLYLYGIADVKNHLFLTILIGLIVSAIISCTVQLGDLVESKFKRTYEVKDFGNILPGHGGILDRFDSLLYSGIVFYIIVIVMEVFILG